MRKRKWQKGMSGMMALALAAATIIPAGTSLAAEKKYTETDTGNGYILVTQQGGKTLGYSPDSGVQLLTEDGYAFKDLNRNGKLDVYEDWRKTTEERASNLAELMTKDREGIESIAGLMLYSGHQAIPGGQFGQGTYDGEKYNPAKNNPWDLADGQITFLRDDNLRHVLLIGVESPEVAAKWNNTAQAFVEGLNFGIPINSSTDPRHDASGTSDVEYQAGAGGDISKWPSSIGLTATFNPNLVREFGQIASIEYRALGIATALSPQIDLATEPRWSRVSGTFGENSKLAADLSRAYVDGFQTTYVNGEAQGWGSDSVNAMVKHWPSGGPEEGGRDGHYGYGKYAVYPGNNFEEQLVPFTEGAFKLSDGTEMASAVMPYYTISYNQDKVNNENVGNGFSKYMITDLLRGKYNYDGVVCTDWMITADTPNDYAFSGKCWGVEDLTVVERHYKVIMAGVDQFGGNNASGPVMGAYDLMVERQGKTFADKRFADSARRLLTNIFNTGLFENPYLDPANTKAVVGSSDFMAAGYTAQLQSVVMIKNKNNIISKAGASKKTVYVEGVSSEIAKKFFNVTDDPAKADMAIVGMTAPRGGSGYDVQDLENGGNGYVPITLQYGTYTATAARETAIANDPGAQFINSETGEYQYTDTVANRSYKGKTVTASNASELTKLQNVKEAMGSKPVVVYMKATNPMVWSEVEPLADGIVIGYGIQDQAALEIISGTTEPSGLLPMQQPANMETVEKQYEDVPQDMVCYKDSQGNTYDFGFGLNWSGQISDARTAKYVEKKEEDKTPTDAELLAQVKVAAADQTIYVGGNTKKTTTIKVTLPAAASKAAVSFESSAKRTATVSQSGKVTAKKKGTVVITTKVKLNSAEKTFTTKIKVKPASIKITKKAASVKVGKSFTFKAKGYGVKNIRWSITSGKQYASIKAKSGKLKAKKPGTVQVTAKVGKVKKTVKVKIKK
ncbi:MAG: glycoside hydrolase family 3 N-terminal domain-containing protein [Hominisplanchenecus sp.]